MLISEVCFLTPLLNPVSTSGSMNRDLRKEPCNLLGKRTSLYMGEFPLSQTEGVLESIQMKVSTEQLNTVYDKVLNLCSWILGE